MYSKRRSRLQNGAGFGDLKKMGERLNKKYSKIAKATGADKLIASKLKTTIKTKLPTIEQKLKSAGVPEKVLTPLTKEIGKQLGKGRENYEELIGFDGQYFNPEQKEQYDSLTEEEKQQLYYETITKMYQDKANEPSWFDNMISALAVLPIPFISDVARTVALVKTAVNTATSDDPVRAFGGVVSDTIGLLENVPVVGALATPTKALAESVGFGMRNATNRGQILKVGVNHLNDLLHTIDTSKLPKITQKKLDNVKSKLKSSLTGINKMNVG